MENPWRPEFLEEVAIYKVIRFMDQVPTNSSTVRTWSQRTLKTANHHSTSGGAVAYEWQIDLCNRLGADFWITVPHLTIEDYEANPTSNYWTELAALTKELLNPELKVYVEYSNETWSGGSSFRQGDYAGERGVSMGFDAQAYTSKFYFHVYAAMRLHKVFLDAFADQPGRVKTVVCGQAGGSPYWGAQQIVRAILNKNGADTRLNPWNLRPDYYSIACYINTGNGADANVRSAWTSQLATAAANYAGHRDLVTPLGMEMIAYEGGQHYTTNAHTFSQNPQSYDMYLEWLEVVSQHFKLVMHYTHVGTWSSGGAWGAKASTNQSIADAHRHRALRDWVVANTPVPPSPLSYAEWRAEQWGSGVADAVAGPTASPLGDSFPNLLKFALGIAANQPGPRDVARLSIENASQATLRFPRRNLALADILVEWSPSLEDGSWATLARFSGADQEWVVGAASVLETGSDEDPVREVSVTVPLPSEEAALLRLRVPLPD